MIFLFFDFTSTKYLGGHSDLVAGSITTASKELHTIYHEHQKMFGNNSVSTRLQASTIQCVGTCLSAIATTDSLSALSVIVYFSGF